MTTANDQRVSAPGKEQELLAIDDLHVEFRSRRGTVQAVRGVSLDIVRGQSMGLVGESGSGKSVTAKAVMGMIDAPGKRTSGNVSWKGRSVTADRSGEEYLRSVRGKEIAIILQDPLSSLNPLFTIGFQISEVLTYHLGLTRRQARAQTLSLMDRVGINAPHRRIDQYPYELSGGMCQRIAIAMALACEPDLLVADEPTTALDVTMQAQILELLNSLRSDFGLALLFISHDLGVVSQVCDTVAVMYGGKILEKATTAGFFESSLSPYSARLLAARPRLDNLDLPLVAIDGSAPDLRDPPDGCPFTPRCDLAGPLCSAEMPELRAISTDHSVACCMVTAKELA